jgi:hypothetical protein
MAKQNSYSNLFQSFFPDWPETLKMKIMLEVLEMDPVSESVLGEMKQMLWWWLWCLRRDKV